MTDKIVTEKKKKWNIYTREQKNRQTYRPMDLGSVDFSVEVLPSCLRFLWVLYRGKQILFLNFVSKTDECYPFIGS